MGMPVEHEHPVTLAELVAAVPRNPNLLCKFQAPPLSPACVKQRLEARFMERYWPALTARFAAYAFENFEETRMSRQRSGDESGAWRLRSRRARTLRAFLLPGSRTEPGVVGA